MDAIQRLEKHGLKERIVIPHAELHPWARGVVKGMMGDKLVSRLGEKDLATNRKLKDFFRRTRRPLDEAGKYDARETRQFFDPFMDKDGNLVLKPKPDVVEALAKAKRALEKRGK